MRQDIKQFIINLLERKQSIPQDVVIDDYQYLDVGHIDSLAIMKFIIQLEKEFGVEISDDDMQTDEFRTVGGLTSIVYFKRCS